MAAIAKIAWGISTCPLFSLSAQGRALRVCSSASPRKHSRISRLQVRAILRQVAAASQVRSPQTLATGVQVVNQDFPRPKLEGAASFVEAAKLSSDLFNAPRPERPLRVVIAGAGTGRHFL